MSFLSPRCNDIEARRQGDQEARRQPPGPGVRRRRPLTGRKRWLSRQVRGQTKAAWREAKKVEAQLLEQLDRGEQRGSRTRTVTELVERWLEWRQQVRPISPVTVANYRGAIDRYITPNLGQAKVSEIDAATLDTPRAGLCPRLAGVGLGGPRGALGAVGRLQAGGGLGLDHPQPGQAGDPAAAGRADVAPPDAEGVARLLTAAMDQDPELGLFLRLAVVLGARRSELVALKWRDVDLGAARC